MNARWKSGSITNEPCLMRRTTSWRVRCSLWRGCWMTGCCPDRPSMTPSQTPSEVRRTNIASRRLITAERLLPERRVSAATEPVAVVTHQDHHWISGPSSLPARIPILLLCAFSPAPRRQSGSAHRAAPGRYADLRSLSRPLPLRSCSSPRRSPAASCRGRSSPSAGSW